MLFNTEVHPFGIPFYLKPNTHTDMALGWEKYLIQNWFSTELNCLSMALSSIAYNRAHSIKLMVEMLCQLYNSIKMY